MAGQCSASIIFVAEKPDYQPETEKRYTVPKPVFEKKLLDSKRYYPSVHMNIFNTKTNHLFTHLVLP